MPGPVALVLFYVVVSMTDVRNDWLHPSLNLVILCLAVIIASTARPRVSLAPKQDDQVDESASLTA